MSATSLIFDAIQESTPGPKWQARWSRSWPAYEAWFIARGGDNGPSRTECEQALHRFMPELVETHQEITQLAGGGDRAARFLSTWCPPQYLGGCSLASASKDGETRLVRNYDLSPELNEGLLLHSNWTGTKVMGMIEFLWGLSDGVNEHGLTVALAYGGRTEVGIGFGITTILRYLLETCRSVDEGVAVLSRVPSHMAYNVALADDSGNTAAIEVIPGGGIRKRKRAIATNHQKQRPTDRPAFTRTRERLQHLKSLFSQRIHPLALSSKFLESPLFQKRYEEGFGTLFTAEYDPVRGALTLLWPGQKWEQSISNFSEGQKIIQYQPSTIKQHDAGEESEFDIAALIRILSPILSRDLGHAFTEARQSSHESVTEQQGDWAAFGRAFYS